jgi:hypothetical protein
MLDNFESTAVPTTSSNILYLLVPSTHLDFFNSAWSKLSQYNSSIISSLVMSDLDKFST